MKNKTSEQVGFIYILRNDREENIFKVGQTSGTVENRIKELNRETSNPGKFEKVAEFPVKKPALVERECHKKLKDENLHFRKEFFQGDIGEIINIVKKITDNHKLIETINKDYFLRKKTIDVLKEKQEKIKVEEYKKKSQLIIQNREIEICIETIDRLSEKIKGSCTELINLMNLNKPIKEKQINYIQEEKKFPFRWFLIFALLCTWAPSTFVVTLTQNGMWFFYLLPLGIVTSYIYIHYKQLKRKDDHLESDANKLHPLHSTSKFEAKILSLVEKRAEQFSLLRKLKGASQKYILKLKFYNENVKPIEKKIETQLKSMNSIIKTITYKP